MGDRSDDEEGTGEEREDLRRTLRVGGARIVAAVTAAMEEVVLTLRGHEEPFSA